MSPPSVETRDAFEAYKALLQVTGPAGLSFLNARVKHRYTAVYRLEGSVLRNMHLFDKQGVVTPDFLAEIPLQDSFCQFVMRDGGFTSTDTGADSRLDGHKYQGVMGSYHGLPLLDNHGSLYGTLCHFDTERHALPDEEFALLQKAARLLPAYLNKRPAAV
ncbi:MULTISPECIES: GAF domain-containing protein [unclassified Acidovorax]|uniref:GAF domain-containing protein n=1 Tax=unclassified Acidovorax TaxID=2684926 RepID=UPI002882DCC8|nr:MULTISPECIES: GAF domain-containing protein [unclassified Acidovorax]